MKKSNKRAPLVFYFGVFVLCMTLFSSHMTGGLYARYTSSASGSDEARVAKFDVTHSDKSIPMSIELDFFDSSKKIDYVEFDVVSDSEVAVKYDVILTLPAAIPTEWLTSGLMIITLDDKAPTSVDGGKLTFSFASNTFSAGVNTTRQHVLKFSLKPDGMPGVSVKITDPATLRIHVEQVD